MLGTVAAAEPTAWGKPVNGVRMALSYIASDGIIEITFENTTDRELFLPLGYLGTGADPLRLVATAGKNTEQVTFTGTSGLGLPPDQQYPMLVPLLPGSRYVVRRPTFRYYVSSARESLGKYMLRHPSLHAVLHPAPASPKLNCFPARYIWSGTLISNVLEIK